MHKRIGRAELVAHREEEEGSAGAVRDVKPAQRLDYRQRTMLVGRNRQYPERFPSEMLLVLFPGMRREVRRAFLRSKFVCRKSERAMGIVPRSISTIKEWREASANWSPKTRSGKRPI
jgi:hypothetical protein